MAENRIKAPRKLKKLEQSDLLTIKDDKDDYYVVTKQEVVKVIRGFIQNEIGNLPDEITDETKKNIEIKITSNFKEIEHKLNSKLEEIEKSLVAFIDYKFDMIAQKACEMLLTRKFIEEVDRKAEELLIKKQTKGKF